MKFIVGEKYEVIKDYGLLRKGVILILRSRDTDIIEDVVTFVYDNANTEIEINIRYETAIDILEPLEIYSKMNKYIVRISHISIPSFNSFVTATCKEEAEIIGIKIGKLLDPNNKRFIISDITKLDDDIIYYTKENLSDINAFNKGDRVIIFNNIEYINRKFKVVDILPPKETGYDEYQYELVQITEDYTGGSFSYKEVGDTIIETEFNLKKM